MKRFLQTLSISVLCVGLGFLLLTEVAAYVGWRELWYSRPDVDVNSGRIRTISQFAGVDYHRRVSDTTFSKMLENVGVSASTSSHWRPAGYRYRTATRSGYEHLEFSKASSICDSIAKRLYILALDQKVANHYLLQSLTLLQAGDAQSLDLLLEQLSGEDKVLGTL